MCYIDGRQAHVLAKYAAAFALLKSKVMFYESTYPRDFCACTIFPQIVFV